MSRGKVRSLFILTIVLFGLLVGYSLVRSRQYLASYALVPPSVGDVDLRLEEVSGGLTKVELVFRTGTSETQVESITTIGLRLKISGNLSGVKIVDSEGKEISGIEPDAELENSGEWDFPVNTVAKEQEQIVVDFSAVNKSIGGYSSPAYKGLATFYLSGVGEGGVLDFEFDEEFSEMYSKRRPVTDIWEE